MAAEVEPSFNQTFLFQLNYLPTSHDQWEKVVGHGANISLCLTMNNPLGNLGEDTAVGRRVRANKTYRELVALAVVEWRQVLMRQDQVFSVELQVG